MPTEAGAPVGHGWIAADAAPDSQVETAVFTNKFGNQGNIQLTAQEVAPRAKERPEVPFNFSVVTELPGPERFFRRQSESDWQQRIRDESRTESGTGRIFFPDSPPLTNEPFQKRQFPSLVAGVEPAYVCHGRLLFEQPNFERQGWDLGFLTPFVNVGVYYYDLALLPYHAWTRPFDCTDCSAGKCLPGDTTPLYLYPEKFSVSGLVAEATVVTGIFFLFP